MLTSRKMPVARCRNNSWQILGFIKVLNLVIETRFLNKTLMILGHTWDQREFFILVSHLLRASPLICFCRVGCRFPQLVADFGWWHGCITYWLFWQYDCSLNSYSFLQSRFSFLFLRGFQFAQELNFLCLQINFSLLIYKIFVIFFCRKCLILIGWGVGIGKWGKGEVSKIECFVFGWVRQPSTYDDSPYAFSIKKGGHDNPNSRGGTFKKGGGKFRQTGWGRGQQNSVVV